jgi:hypothetical protein
MRMDIEYSPGALGQRSSAAARNFDGLASGEGVMNGKRLCSMDHPAAVRGERARRFFAERTMGVLWRHSSVNLVVPRSIALSAAHFSGDCRRSQTRLASPVPRRNRRNGRFDRTSSQKSGDFRLSLAQAISH